ncbi:hypothetical protein ILYODFUR_020676 [Ilyodon furcidens]|uniref:Uncharacterized protein n=1 Tax=Ilyodon furcidens TaxID=33524 RepID=A0ABV0VG98_9TELE
MGQHYSAVCSKNRFSRFIKRFQLDVVKSNITGYVYVNSNHRHESFHESTTMTIYDVKAFNQHCGEVFWYDHLILMDSTVGNRLQAGIAEIKSSLNVSFLLLQ